MSESGCEGEKGVGPPAGGGGRPLDYYYDDGTGYEVYDPVEEEAEEGVPGGEADEDE
jgi:hypothetical protein